MSKIVLKVAQMNHDHLIVQVGLDDRHRCMTMDLFHSEQPAVRAAWDALESAVDAGIRCVMMDLTRVDMPEDVSGLVGTTHPCRLCDKMVGEMEAGARSKGPFWYCPKCVESMSNG